MSRKMAAKMSHAHTVNPRRRARWFRIVTVVSTFAFLVASTQPAGADDGSIYVTSTEVFTSTSQITIGDQPPVLSGTNTLPVDNYTLAALGGGTFTPAPLLSKAALDGQMLNPAQQVVPAVTAADAAEQSALANLSQTAVANALAAHDLPSSDAAAMQTWGRNETLPFLWSLLVQAAETPAASRTSDQAQAVRWLNDMETRQAVISTQDSGREYAKWAGIPLGGLDALMTTTPDQTALTNYLSANPTPYTGTGSQRNPGGSTDGGYCVYRPPAPFETEYTGNIFTPWQQSSASSLCYGSCPSLVGCPPPTPTVEQFTKWGAADAEKSTSSADFATASGSVGLAAGLGATAAVGAPAAGITAAATLASTMAGGGFEASIFPYAAAVLDFAVASSTTAAASGSAASAAGAAATAAEVGGSVAAAGVGAIIGAFIFAVAVAVLEGIQIFDAAGLPGQIASAIASAPNYSADVSGMTGNASVMQGLYALFMTATQPTPTYQRCADTVHVGDTGGASDAPCLNAPDVAAAAPSDHVFSVTPEGSSTVAMQPTLTWRDAESGTTATAHVKRNWFVTTMALNGAPPVTIQTLRMRYSDWDGVEHTAWLYDEGSQAQFLTVRNDAVTASFDPASCISSGACAFSPTIQVVDGQGNDVTVGVGALPTPPTQVDTSLALSMPNTVPSSGDQLTVTATVTAADGTAPVGGSVTFWQVSDGLTPSVQISGCIDVPVSTTAPYTATCTGTVEGSSFPRFSRSIGGFAVLGASYTGSPTAKRSDSEKLWFPVSSGTPTSVKLSADTPDGTFTFRETGRLVATITTENGKVPTGGVRFTDDRGNVCIGEVHRSPSRTDLQGYASVDRASDGTWQAVCDMTGASAYTTDYEQDLGTRNWTALYSGDSQNQPSWATGSFTIKPSPTTTTLTASAAQVAQGTSVTFTATVSDPDVFRDQDPTGNEHTVTFTQGTKVLCANVPVGPQHGPQSFAAPNGSVYRPAAYSTSTEVTATCSAVPDPGEQTVTATYNPEAKYAASSATTTVSAGSTSTVQVAGPYNPVFGSSSSYTATVISDGLPNEASRGTVTFSLGDTVVCDHVPVNTPVGGGWTTATCPITPSQVGAATITAHYGGATQSNGTAVLPASGSLDVVAVPDSTLPVMHGVISDGSGNALADVCVSLWSGPTQVQTACTDSNGIYEMDDVAPGDYTVSFTDSHGVRATQWAGTKGTLNIYSGVATQAEATPVSLTSGIVTVSAHLSAMAGTISGTVHLADGNTAGQACVYLYNQNGSYAGVATCTNALGDYVLSGVGTGGYRIAVVDPGGQSPVTWYGDVTDQSAGTVVSAFADSAVTGIDVNQAPIAPMLRGRVADQAGNSLEGVCVSLWSSSTQLRTACTGADGTYEMDDVAPGDYTVSFVDSHGVSPTQWAGTKGALNFYSGVATQAEATPISFTGGPVTVSTLMAPQTGTISGTVHFPAGSPTQHACVYLYNQNGSYAGSSTCTNAQGDYVLSGVVNGSFRVAVVDPLGLTPTTWYGNVTDESEGTVVSGFADSNVSGVDVNLGIAPGSIIGRVTDATGTTGLAGICVYVYAYTPPNGDQSGTVADGATAATCTNSDGYYALTDLPKGNGVYYQVAYVDPTGALPTQWVVSSDATGTAIGTATSSTPLPDGAITMDAFGYAYESPRLQSAGV